MKSKEIREKEFLKFHSGYYGEEVDNIKQMVKCSFSGKELLEYINAAIEQLQPKEESLEVEELVTNFISSLKWNDYDSIIECDMERLLLQFSEYATQQSKQVSDEDYQQFCEEKELMYTEINSVWALGFYRWMTKQLAKKD